MQGNYSVEVESFAERHFIKGFQKKYKKQWEVTFRAITAELEHIDKLIETDRAETVYDVDGLRIVKTKFKVAGTKESAKTSGNRCIVAWYPDRAIVYILLVYGKTDLGGAKETVAWTNLVKENYPQYKNLF